MIVSGDYLTQNVSLYLVGEMCVFVSRSIDIATFVGKKRWPLQNEMLIFFRGKRHIPKNMEIVKDSVENCYNNNNGNPWKSWKIFRVKQKKTWKSVNNSFFLFPFFIFHFHFSSFYHFFIVSFSI